MMPRSFVAPITLAASFALLGGVELLAQETSALEPLPAEPPIGGPFWTIAVPALLFLVSATATFPSTTCDCSEPDRRVSSMARFPDIRDFPFTVMPFASG